MNRENLSKHLLELLRRTSAYLPPDVEDVLKMAQKFEEKGSKADFALDMVMQNIGLAKKRSLPICQDTGTITFYVKCPVGYNQIEFHKAAEEAVVTATKIGYLRQNAVDSLSGKNSGTNLGLGSPVFHIEQWEKDQVDVRLVLKGGGCENMSTQYKLPATFNGKLYGRDLEGVRACILDAVFQAQGKGCGPGFLGVCIGADRASSYEWAKHQLLREVDDVNPVEELAQLEERIMREANRLEIGPMGFGGKLTLGSCKIGFRHRLPASFFVSVAYMCWAFRRRGVILTADNDVKEWLYQGAEEFEKEVEGPDTFVAPTKNVQVLNAPFSEKAIRSLHVGDVVLINGTIFTGRDAVHKYLYDGGELDIIKGGMMYHCGPVMIKENNEYKVMAAGPTTSIREEPYQGDVIKKFDLKAVIGKGGMGAKTLQACQDHGSVYLHAIGGAAQVYALTVKKVKSVHLEQFGSPEAVWELEVEGFPAVVTMDSHGESLHKEVQDASQLELEKILQGAS
ncbi:fumarate hydratase [candidate division KSB1 bacterium RBG_16_48_16]|nr:MAG: fumarate hydratase [candidate division KSB1 bacterium RBG_16_48_16]